jgi:DNA-binding MarR family transcriptional regulator
LSILTIVNATPAIEEPTATADLRRSGADLDRLRLVLLRLARRIRTSSAGSITPSQLAVVATVVRHGPVTVGQIAELEQVRPPSASRIVAALEEQALVERHADPDDRRRTLIGATVEGEEYLAQVRAAGRGWLASRLDELDDDDVRVLEGALATLERLLGSAE